MFEILLVDDNRTDVEIMQEALEGGKVSTRLHAACDGVEAMAFLRREDAYRDAPRPDLILLDMKMPRMGGLEVLAAVKGDPDLRSIPTVMLTSSKEGRDVARAYELQANGFVQKPLDFDDFLVVMGGIEQFWTSVATVPARMTALPTAAG
jgi:CheY-like chemotaxis protein